MAIDVKIGQEFEECLDIQWTCTYADTFKEFVVEMVLDRSDRDNNKGKPPMPAKDAMVKRVSMGKGHSGCIQNMPEGRNFLVCVVCEPDRGPKIRSPWVRAVTLSPQTRDKKLENLDPMGVSRTNCKLCPCVGYIPFDWGLNTPDKMRCRRCGCQYADHVVLELTEILKMREQKACARLRRDSVVELPKEAIDWDNRECSMWFCTNGVVHPRLITGEHRPPARIGAKTSPGGPHGSAGKKGRVSVVTPTTDSRHKFHELLYKCFDAQTWPDKELVVVETYAEHHSRFFDTLAKNDSRITYVKFQRPRGDDWSIGLKRNIGAHLATGEFIANFDDDDLYAPEFLSTMVTQLEKQKAQIIKLSSWYIYNMGSNKWGFCDPIAWGLTQGLDENADDVRNWAYGYGFSYVFRRQIGLDYWYEDINLGEDFKFITSLQHRRGERSIILFHDDFGICLHVQHGGNTSNSIPLREVSREEALDLDVMELSAHLQESHLSIIPAGGLLATAIPPSKRHRKVIASMVDREITVECAISATISDFRACLTQMTGEQCGTMSVYRVQPLTDVALKGNDEDALELQRDEQAADVLGIAFLADMPGAKENLMPDSRSGKQWRKLLEQAKHPMQSWERIGLRTTELWVLPPEHGAAEVDTELEVWEKTEVFLVHATCQTSSAKQFFSTIRGFDVNLPVGSSVATMRGILGDNLPAKAKVLAEKKGKGVVELKDTELVPSTISVSEFKGSRSYYTWFTKDHGRTALRMMKKMFVLPEYIKRFDKFEMEAGGNHMLYRAALGGMLQENVYPAIFHRFNFPDDDNGLRALVEALAIVPSDWELSELWLEVETLMRNQVNIKQAVEAVAAHRRSAGVEPLSVEPTHDKKTSTGGDVAQDHKHSLNGNQLQDPKPSTGGDPLQNNTHVEPQHVKEHTTSRQIGTGNYNKNFYRKHSENSHPANTSNTLFDFDLLEDSSTNVEKPNVEEDTVCN